METTVARQITLFSAEKKIMMLDVTLRQVWPNYLYLELLGATDSALQIHGGNGYALEYPSVGSYAIQESLIFLKGLPKFRLKLL